MTTRSEDRPTKPVDPKDVQSTGAQWPYARACLEKLGPWALVALRRGAASMLEDVAHEMSKTYATADLIDVARMLIEALAHMSWDASDASDDST